MNSQHKNTYLKDDFVTDRTVCFKYLILVSKNKSDSDLI